MTRQTRATVLLFLPLALLAGCGSKKESSPPPPPPPQLLPPAATADEWAGRIVNRLLRPTNRDIQVLLALNNPQTKIYIQERNQNTLRILNNRIGDLGRCSDRLTAIGSPPQIAGDKRQLNRIDGELHLACRHYVKVSEIVLDAVGLMSSESSDDHLRGLKRLAEARTDAQAAAVAYDKAVRIAQGLAEFRRHGLKPPA